MDEILLVYTTWPEAETAEAAALQAIESRLAACANILAPMRSLYRWDGEIQREVEIAMLLKTRRSCAEALRALVLRLHPYSTPCLIVLPVSAALCNPAFLDWIAEETDGTDKPR